MAAARRGPAWAARTCSISVLTAWYASDPVKPGVKQCSQAAFQGKIILYVAGVHDDHIHAKLMGQVNAAPDSLHTLAPLLLIVR